MTETRYCEYTGCGQAFDTDNDRKRFCSPRCKAAAHDATRPAGARRPLISSFCDYCGAPYSTRHPQQKFCSAAHRRAFNQIVDFNARVVMRAVRESVREIIRARTPIQQGD